MEGSTFTLHSLEQISLWYVIVRVVCTQLLRVRRESDGGMGIVLYQAAWLVRNAYTSSVGKPVVLVETVFEIGEGVDAGIYQNLHLVDSPGFRSYPWTARMAGSMGEGMHE